MRRIHLSIGALGLLAFLFFPACDGGPAVNDFLPDTPNDDSVGDMTPDGDGPTNPGPVFPVIDSVRARVRNESSARADVTVRFIRNNNVVHLAFVRVLPDTITTVASPETAELVELSGLDERGRALNEATFVFGVDFDEALPAEYIVVDEGVEPSPEAPVEAPGGRPVLPRLTMVEPAQELTLSLGTTLTARWTDTAGSPGVVVTIFLQPAAATGERELIALGPGVGAALDGINDELQVVVQDLAPGDYRVAGRVQLPVDGGTLEELSFAPGLVRVERDPENDAPTLRILSPRAAVGLKNGDSFALSWDDFDSDDNATISFSLVSTGRVDAAAETFDIGPPIAENPDGTRFDTSALVIRDVLPGLYDLVGTIDDGELLGTDRVENAVHVLAAVDNDAPQLEVLQPSEDVEVQIVRSFLVTWTDTDANDDARISLLLDPDLENVALDGDEILLAVSLGENADGAGDQITLGIPPWVVGGEYRLVGAITDGLTQLLTHAPGLIRVIDDEGITQNFGGDGDGGGRNIIIGPRPPAPPPPSPPPPTPPPPAPPEPTWEVTPIAPIEAPVIQSGESITVYSEAEVELGGWRRVYLSNTRYGGAVRVEAERVELQADRKTLLVPVQIGSVPNDAWPRSFDVEVETLVGGEIQIDVGARPVWILQQAEIIDIALVGHSCIPTATSDAAARAASVDISWYGGGWFEEDAHLVVQFWLSKDGTVPEGGESDSTHRLIGQTPGSPNDVRNLRFDAQRPYLPENIAGGIEALNLDESAADSSLEAGDYFLVTVFDPDGVNRMVSGPFIEPIPVCDSTRSSDTDKQP